MTTPQIAPADPFEALIARLVDQNGFTAVTAASAKEFAAAPGDAVLLLTDEQQRSPESWDVAVVLPEVLKGLSGRLRAGIANPAESRALAAGYAVSRFPSLVFLRDGGYVGVLEGMLNWGEFGPAIADMLTRPVGRVPGIGIPVHSQVSSSCH